jgi:hypothetical protein
MQGTVTYYIEKINNTSADTLLAIGFASLLGDLCRVQLDSQDEVVIRDQGTCYVVTSAEPLDLEALTDQQLNELQICLPLASDKQRDRLAKKIKEGESTYNIQGFNYEKKKEDSRAYRERRKAMGPGYQAPEAQFEHYRELQELDEADTRLDHYTAIISMKIANTFNDLALRWEKLTPTQKREHLTLLCEYFSQPYQDSSELVTRWQQLARQYLIKDKPMATALQIINPTAGKGANRAKASGLSIGNQESFWFLELLKFRGFMEGAAPLLIDNGDDRKTYVIQPREIKIAALQSMMKTFRAVFWSTTAVKLDILASLRFAQVFVHHHKRRFEQQAYMEAFMQPTSLLSIAHGFDVTFYQWLGSAYATMNVATIGVPIWLPQLDSLEQVTQEDELLKEHIHIINHLRTSRGDEGSEEYELLRIYRDFLSSNDLKSFWQFATRYGTYVLHQREQEKNVQRHVRQLSYTGMEIIVKNTQPHLTEITGNDSFKRIAAAIRGATVVPQRRKAQGQDPVYEIRYGLGQELRRSARHTYEFMITLSEFLQSYTEENAREIERAAKTSEKKPRYLRVAVSMEDLHAVEDLIDRFESSELIGTMLAACGYMKETSWQDGKNEEDNTTS